MKALECSMLLLILCNFCIAASTKCKIESCRTNHTFIVGVVASGICGFLAIVFVVISSVLYTRILEEQQRSADLVERANALYTMADSSAGRGDPQIRGNIYHKKSLADSSSAPGTSTEEDKSAKPRVKRTSSSRASGSRGPRHPPPRKRAKPRRRKSDYRSTSVDPSSEGSSQRDATEKKAKNRSSTMEDVHSVEPDVYCRA